MYIAIIDFGSQTTMLIARRVRELGVLAKVFSYHDALAKINIHKPWGIILSGGPASVYEKDSPVLDENLIELAIPILGICYGMQLLAKYMGGQVSSSTHKEFGKHSINIDCQSLLFHNLDNSISVWMSHGDEVSFIEHGRVIAQSSSCPLVGIEWAEKKIWGIQFHPEVYHTSHGQKILANFVFNIAQAEKNFMLDDVIDHQVKDIKNIVKDDHVIMALSGGLDSSVAALIIAKAIGGNLHGVFVDHGLHRENEAQDIYHSLKNILNIDVVMIDAREQFFNALAGVIDPEVKRQIIGHIFIEVFMREAYRWPKVKFLGQGTLYPDVIESINQPIKTHHNVGGLPKDLSWHLIEPLRSLFKDEVKNIALKLKLPSSIINRQPFPGPGLAVRIAGAVTKARVDTLRQADEIVRQEIEKIKHSLPKDLWQWFAILLPLKNVGVMGDKRCYGDSIVIRCVQSIDAMTADFCKLPYEVLEQISRRITNEILGVTRVLYDITPKPPGTIEWE